MEYVFGTEGSAEVLKTKGSAHTDLTGFQQVERTYPDQTITDSFRVVRRLGRRVDPEGNCYDWYEIDRHYRFTDKTAPVKATVASVENAVCELDEHTDERMGALEDALCDLDAAINGGGESNG